MGCAISSTSDQVSNPRVFDVANIDDGGQERSAGKIEVTEAELVLHYPGRQSIRWPLQSLRRYGYNDHLFSFESGRRCPTGHGIYAFRCVNAELLFHQLQQAIVRAGEERARTVEPGPRREEVQYLPTDWSSTGSVLQPQGIQLGQLDNRFADYISYPHFSSTWRTYVNQHIADQQLKSLASTGAQEGPGRSDRKPSSGGRVQYADLDLPVFCDAIEMEDYDEEADVFQPPEMTNSEPPFRSTYVNVPIPPGNASPLFTRDLRTWLPNNAIVPAPLTSSRAAKVTYAQLDLDTPRPSPEGTTTGPTKPECTPRDKSDMYAAIDFQRTRALSTKTTDSEDEGFRKTRHNSNIEMLTRN